MSQITLYVIASVLALALVILFLFHRLQSSDLLRSNAREIALERRADSLAEEIQRLELEVKSAAARITDGCTPAAPCGFRAFARLQLEHMQRLTATTPSRAPGLAQLLEIGNAYASSHPNEIAAAGVRSFLAYARTLSINDDGETVSSV